MYSDSISNSSDANHNVEKLWDNKVGDKDVEGRRSCAEGYCKVFWPFARSGQEASGFDGVRRDEWHRPFCMNCHKCDVYIPKTGIEHFQPEIDLRLFKATGTVHFDGLLVEELK